MPDIGMSTREIFSIYEAGKAIERIKATLRDLGVASEDYPDDINS